jgi:thiol-disulfide isomerase/thioredoxin
MPFVIAAVALVGVLCALDLVLTFGVIKRLREHTELLADNGTQLTIAKGGEVGDFAASTVDGEHIDHDILRDNTLVAFFSPTCQPCKEKVPTFVEYARSLPGGRDSALAVVVGDADQADAQIDELSRVARVVFEEKNTEPVCSAFQVMGFPAVVMVGKNGHGRAVVLDDKVELGRPAAVV